MFCKYTFERRFWKRNWHMYHFPYLEMHGRKSETCIWLLFLTNICIHKYVDNHCLQNKMTRTKNYLQIFNIANRIRCGLDFYEHKKTHCNWQNKKRIIFFFVLSGDLSITGKNLSKWCIGNSFSEKGQTSFQSHLQFFPSKRIHDLKCLHRHLSQARILNQPDKLPVLGSSDLTLIWVRPVCYLKPTRYQSQA